MITSFNTSSVTREAEWKGKVEEKYLSEVEGTAVFQKAPREAEPSFGSLVKKLYNCVAVEMMAGSRSRHADCDR